LADIISPATSSDTSPSTSHAPAVAAIAVLAMFAFAAAISVDVVRIGYGVKGDEATYVAMALSAAYDHDLRYERRDLERFWGLYRSGPEGLFLKRGSAWHLRLKGAPPFVQVARTPENPNRLYFAKAFAYPLAAAPFVRAFGLNGLFVLQALIAVTVVACGYAFVAATSSQLSALLYALAFVGASVVPLYAVFLTSDLFNFGLVFIAYFLWLYKEVAPAQGGRFLRTDRSDFAAAIILGIASYSKLTNALLVAPIVLLLWARRRFQAGTAVAVVFAAMLAAMLALNLWVTGELNYQGGDRKTFYGRFPFDTPEASWDRVGIVSATDDADTKTVFDRGEVVRRTARNVEYFLIGRHSGFIPYFFPGFIATLLWLLSRERKCVWRLLVFVALGVSVAGLLIFFPYSWNGGGGPPGNRYFLSLYPVLFFLTPPLGSLVGPIVAWAGGALFTAHMLVNPFATGKFTYLAFERGAARRLPVELTIANDLPVRLSTSPIRARIPYGHDPEMLLYFLDQNAFPPEPPGMWVAGGRRAEIIVRSEERIDHLSITAESPIPTTLTIAMGAAAVTVRIAPHSPVSFNVPASGIQVEQSYAYLLTALSSDGFVPHLMDPSSQDSRNLGALVRFAAVRGAVVEAPDGRRSGEPTAVQ
jgi:hypothetical protein